MTSMLTRFGDDPIAPESAQFPLPTDETATAEVAPSENGVRPWGLRRMTTVTPPECAPGPQGTYNRSVRSESTVRVVRSSWRGRRRRPRPEARTAPRVTRLRITTTTDVHSHFGW